MKSFMQKWGVTLYILVLMMHLYAQILGETYQNVQIVTKLLLLPLLILLVLSQETFNTAPKWKWFIIIALIGSLIGDAFLLSNAYFIPGMVAFMTTHIFNILFFNKVHGIGQATTNKWKAVLLLLVGFCVFIYMKLSVAMGGLIYPVLVYMILICFAALMSIQAGGNKKAALISSLFWFPGMLFFISSDAVLAFNKFSWEKTGPHIHNIGLVTMLTYATAQLLLVKGFILYFKQSEQI
jgi:uncharacterized membrane protein YhhN